MHVTCRGLQNKSTNKSHPEIYHLEIKPTEKKKLEIRIPSKKPPGNRPHDKNHPEKSHQISRRPVRSQAVNKPTGQKKKPSEPNPPRQRFFFYL